VAKLDDVIKKLEKVRDKLERPTTFFEQMKQRYRQLCVSVTHQVRDALMPPDADEEEYRAQTDAMAKGIEAAVVTEEQIGLNVFMWSRFAQKDGQTTLQPFIDPADITVKDIEAWVRAGFEEDPLGKEIDERDREGLTPQGQEDLIDDITYRVLYAVKRGHGNIVDPILDYIDARGSAGETSLLREILIAWKEIISTVVKRDYPWWVGKTIDNPDRA